MIKIEFEGIDGSGKTTAMGIADRFLRDIGYRVVTTKEVGNPHVEVCQKLRSIVLDPKYSIDIKSMELIFSAMRIENQVWLESISKPEKKFDFVLSDRGMLSHLAYCDGIGGNAEFTKNLYLNLIFKYTEFPDLIFYFDIDPEIALQRRVSRGETFDSIENRGVEKQKSVRESYTNYINKFYDQIYIIIINANQDINSIENELKNHLVNFIKLMT